MRKIVVGTALWFGLISGAIFSAGVAAADRPAVDDWPVSRTYVRSTMYVDSGDAYALASAGGCTAAATDDSCA